ncbi:MAG: UvrD-helicase domain-containing protein [Deltaproteobacteria bacterium]|nr:UvrD-helicase domain-containing protein [Deltaproteobacteria bacterium]
MANNNFELRLEGKDYILFKNIKIIIDCSSKTNIIRNFLFSSVILHAQNKKYIFRGLSNKNAKILYNYIDNIIKNKIEFEKENLNKEIASLIFSMESAKKAVEDFLQTDKYIANRDKLSFVESIEWEKLFKPYKKLISKPLFVETPNHEKLTSLFNYLNHFFNKADRVINDRNDEYAENEIKKYDNLFKRIEHNPLTHEQAIGAVIMEENNLVVAAAGSGKTSVITGKVAYVIEKGLFKPEEIVCIAFNKNAAKEMQERLESKKNIVKNIDKVKAQTFHSFGLSVIKKKETKNILGEGESNSYINKAITSLLGTDTIFKINYFLLKSTIHIQNPVATDFANQEEYDRYLENIYKNNYQNKGIKTLSGHFVRSFEEAVIANWLYIHGIDFEYEKQWEEGRISAEWDSYNPDFYYPKAKVYHEHFALNKKFKAPAFFDNPEEYELQAKRKIEIMKKLNPLNFYTTSAEYFDGTLLDKLENKIKSLGLNPILRDNREIDEKLKEIGINNIDVLILRGVSLVKSNGFTKKHLLNRINRQKDIIRARLFIEVLTTIIKKYNEILKEDNKIDYADMIGLAGKYLDENIVDTPYKFMLIDEFQDITSGEAKMIKAALDQHEDGILFGVGDDWQSINGFQGADLNIFNGFASYFGPTNEVYLTKTFRSNQGISDIASLFVQEDSFLKRKSVSAVDKRKNAVINIKTYKDDAEIKKIVEESIQNWLSIDSNKKRPKIFILSRYTMKHTVGLDADDVKSIKELFNDVCDIEFSTIHGSKGLEADYIIILGLFDISIDWRCFPGILENDPLLDLMLPQNNSGIEYPEERRLFYVALTRAKKEAVILSNKYGYSPFMLDIIRQPKKDGIIFNDSCNIPKVCPKCGTGLLVERQNRENSNKFLGCENYTKGCRYTEHINEYFMPTTKKPAKSVRKKYRYTIKKKMD